LVPSFLNGRRQVSKGFTFSTHNWLVSGIFPWEKTQKRKDHLVGKPVGHPLLLNNGSGRGPFHRGGLFRKTVGLPTGLGGFFTEKSHILWRPRGLFSPGPEMGFKVQTGALFFLPTTQKLGFYGALTLGGFIQTNRGP